MNCRILALPGLVLLMAVAFPRPAWANGDLFFEAAEIPGNTEYVVFGNVKDQQGRYLDYVTVTVTVTEPRLIYTTQTEVLGRYRSLDVGRAIRGLGYDVVPSRISVTAASPGYHVVRQLYRGKHGQAKGAIEVNFVMAKDRATRSN